MAVGLGKKETKNSSKVSSLRSWNDRVTISWIGADLRTARQLCFGVRRELWLEVKIRELGAYQY